MDTNTSRAFCIVLTNNFDSEGVLYSEKDALDFIAYFKQTQSCEFYTFGVSDGIRNYANRLGITNSVVLKTTGENGLAESEFTIEVPTFLRQQRKR